VGRGKRVREVTKEGEERRGSGGGKKGKRESGE
jgi:hypothetical protein